VASVHDDDLLFSPHDWSPDGTALLYSTSSAVPDANYPEFSKSDPSTTSYHILRVDGSPPELVPDVLVLRETWYGSRNVTYRCLGEMKLEAWCNGNDGEIPTVDVFVGGEYVGTGRNIKVVGFIERE
jgi:hypothetical protein